MMTIIQGRRIDPPEDNYGDLEPGDYGHNVDGWFCRTPNGLLGMLNSHTIIEHEDGTITVSPSILSWRPSGDETVQWHGYLEHGIWKEV